MEHKILLREIKRLVNIGAATDVTDWSGDRIYELLDNIDKEQIGYSVGIYGCNGVLIKDRKTGDLYAVTARSTSMFILL